MSWIKTVTYDESTGRLRQLYDRVKGPDNNVDNIMMAHSLRPHSMEGHMALYKYVLHHSANAVPKWFLEAIGTYVSHLNRCDYCFEHHFVGLKRNLRDDNRAEAIRAAILAGDISAAPLDAREKAALAYARALTLTPAEMTRAMVEQLRAAGYDDGEILEINQVTAYFGYANRTVLGLGCSTDGDIIGLSPNNSADPDDWSHR
ncbi:MAG TPA: peroxidase-related enzyme [Rhabdaerophilum sp.]|nr:peroxidase-related enzyme [Rhabdaerophilum sp.]